MPSSGTLTKAYIIDAMAERIGKFCVKKKRRGRNPATGEDMILAPKRSSHFNAREAERED
jgi:hypothetical protein